MRFTFLRLTSLAAALCFFHVAHAADQTQTGAGNARAMQLASHSPLVTSAMELVKSRLTDIQSAALRSSLTELTQKPETCIQHRTGLSPDDKQRLLDALDKAGLIDATEATRLQGGLLAGVFPPVLNDSTACPQVPVAFYAAPGGATGGHHSEPGGLPVHEAFNSYSAGL